MSRIIIVIVGRRAGTPPSYIMGSNQGYYTKSFNFNSRWTRKLLVAQVVMNQVLKKTHEKTITIDMMSW